MAEIKLKLNRRSRLIALAGVEMGGGGRWQSALAEATGLSQSYISMMAAGQRPVTDAVEFKVIQAIDREIIRLTESAETLTRIRDRIQAGREKRR